MQLSAALVQSRDSSESLKLGRSKDKNGKGKREENNANETQFNEEPIKQNEAFW